MTRKRNWTPEQKLRRAEQNKEARKKAREVGKCCQCKTRWCVVGFKSCADCMGEGRKRSTEIPTNLLWMEDGVPVY